MAIGLRLRVIDFAVGLPAAIFAAIGTGSTISRRHTLVPPEAMTHEWLRYTRARIQLQGREYGVPGLVGCS